MDRKSEAHFVRRYNDCPLRTVRRTCRLLASGGLKHVLKHCEHIFWTKISDLRVSF
jgi:hypothetical protein